MASYDIYTYVDSGSNKQKYLVVPQRCGSSFTKDIIDKFSVEDRSDLQVVPESLPGEIMNRFNDSNKAGISELRLMHLTFPSTIDLTTVYRHPVARYASALPMLGAGSWEHFSEWLASGKVDLRHGTRDRIVAEGYAEIMGIPIEAIDGNAEKMHNDYAIDRMLDTVIQLHPFGAGTNIWWDPMFGESHLRPVMLQNAVMACLCEKPKFIELEDYTEWAEQEILTNSRVIPTDVSQLTSEWHNGRSHMPKGSSAVASVSGQYCMDYLIENFPIAFDESRNCNGSMYPLNFSKFIAPELDTYNYIYSEHGHFTSKEPLVDFLVELFAKYPYAITRNPYALRWFSLDQTLEKLPLRLANAIRENIKAGLQSINDQTYFHVVEYLK